MQSLKTYKLKNLIYEHREAIMVALTFIICVTATIMFHATETDVGTAINSGASHLLTEVEKVYCGSLAFLLMAIEIAVFLISKNDKAKQAALVSFIGCLVAFIVIKILASGNGGIIGNTLDTMQGWTNG